VATAQPVKQATTQASVEADKLLLPQPAAVAATRAACQGLQGLQVRQESQDDPVNPVLQDCQAIQASHQCSHANQSRHHHASRAHKARPVPLVHPDHQVMLEPLDNQATQEPTHHQASQARKAPLVHQDSQVHQAPPESQALQRKANHSSQANLAQQELLVHKDLPDHQDSQVTMEPPANPARRDHPAPMASPAQTEIQELPAKLDHQEVLARRVSAPSIAPSTVVSSSKMAHGDRQQRQRERSLPTTRSGRKGYQHQPSSWSLNYIILFIFNVHLLHFKCKGIQA